MSKMNKMQICVEGTLDMEIVKSIVDLIAEHSNYFINRSCFFIDRANGISKVVSKLNKSNYTAIGIIDNDKIKPKLIENYTKCKEYDDLNLVLYYYDNNGAKIFLLAFNKASEDWLLNASREHSLPYFNSIAEIKKNSKKCELTTDFLNIIKSIIRNNSLHSIFFRRLIYGIYSRYRV